MKHEILVYNKTRRRVPEKLIKSVISKALDFLKPKQPVELAVLIVYKDEIKLLNKSWRKKNYTPDELSFGLNSRQATEFAKQRNRVLELGEIVVNGSKIADKNHFARILIHSLLHLMGDDHEKSIEGAMKMKRLEEKILKYLLKYNILAKTICN